MATAPERAASDLDDDQFDAGALVRTAFWGMGAAGALLLAVLAALSETGTHRMAVAVASLAGQVKALADPMPPKPVPVAAAKPSPELHLRQQTRRLQEQVRLLAADRDRLAQRIGTLEHSLEDVTGSIRRQEALTEEALAQATAAKSAAAQAASPAPPTVQMAAVAPAARAPPAEPRPLDGDLADPAPDVTGSVPAEKPLPSSRHEAEPAAPASAAPSAAPKQARASAAAETPRTHAAYGVDLGGAISVERLRLLWQTLQSSEAKLLQGLHPVTRSRGLKRGGQPDMRLIAGPLANADAAAKLCAAILDAGRYCEPAVFHGQRLSSR